MDPLPVLWLCGPAGVGKSTIAWALYEGLPDGAAYVDVDQLGMCYPELPGDPGRTLLEGRIVGDLAMNFRAAGASCLVVSGYIDADTGIHTDLLAGVDLHVVRLRCGPAELARRLVERDPGPEFERFRTEAVVEADHLDRAGLPYPVLDTTALSPTETLAAVREGWSWSPPAWPSSWPALVPAGGEILWITGPAASGKSMVAWEVFQRSIASGHLTGFADLGQLGFLRGRDDHRLRAANVAALWRRFHEHGARRLVLAGSVRSSAELALYREALTGARLTLHRLHAGTDSLRERIRRRTGGEGPRIAGDALLGLSDEARHTAWEAAVAEAASLDAAGLGDHRVDTDGRSVVEIAATLTWAEDR